MDTAPHPDIRESTFDAPESDYFANARFEMLQFIPPESKMVLDCGCGKGVFGALVKRERNAHVWGIEIHADAAREARTVLDEVLTGDVGAQMDSVPDAHFDCIVFNDVLEHLVDPWAVLTAAKKKLSARGVVVCSVPNIRFFKVFREYVVRGEWRYEDFGICDRTHLHCFTAKSLRGVLEGLGYDIVKLTGINPMTTWKFTVLNALALGRLSDTRYLQFACVAKPK